MKRLAVLVLALVPALALAGAWLFWKDHVEPPAVDTQALHPLVAETIETAAEEVRRDNRSPEAWGRLGMVLVAHGFMDNARTCFSRAFELSPVNFKWPYLIGYTFEGVDFAKALEQYQTAHVLNRSYVPLQVRMAQILMRQGAFQECRELLRTALQLEPSNPYALLLSGQLELQSDDLPAARESLLRAAEAPGWWPWPAYQELLTLAVRRGDLQEAYRYKQQLTAFPEVARLELPDPVLEEVRKLEGLSKDLAQRADAALARGDVNTAILHYREFLEKRQDMPTAYVNLGRAYSLSGRHGEAIAIYQTALKRFGGTVRLHYALALAYDRASQPKRALEECRKALAHKPNDSTSLFLKGTLEEGGDPRAALESYRAAAAADPTFPQAQLAAGVLLMGQGRAEEARPYIERAAALVPGDPLPQKYLHQLDEMRPKHERGAPSSTASEDDSAE